MKRIIFILVCCVMVVSCKTAVYTEATSRGTVEGSMELRKGRVNIDTSSVHNIIVKWAEGKDGFVPDKNDPNRLYRKVDKAIDALMIVHQSLLSQSPDLIKVTSNCYEYEKDHLHVCHQEMVKGDIIAETTVTFTLKNKPEIYTLVFTQK